MGTFSSSLLGSDSDGPFVQTTLGVMARSMRDAGNLPIEGLLDSVMRQNPDR